MMKITPLLSLLMFIALATGCDHGVPVAEAAAAPADSIRPIDEALARFRDGTEARDTLTGGAASLDGLVADFTAAVASGDSVALERMALDRAEYGWIYFPSLRRMNPGLNLQPEVMWLLLEQHGRKGMVRVLRRLGGGEARFGAHRCEDAPQVEGENRYWHRCTVNVIAPDGSSMAMQLFGSVMERGRRYKFVSYANDF